MDERPAHPDQRYALIVPLIIGCAQFMHQFDGAVIATALPAMAESLAEDPLKLNLAIASYLLALAVFVPVSGWMADRFGAKRVFAAAIVVFTASSVLCGLAHSLWALVVWRTLQGMGGAMMTPVGRVIVVKSVPKQHLVQAMNWITVPAVLGPVLGPSVGGFIVSYFSWPWIFFINLPIGVLGLVLTYAYIPDLREPRPSPLDVRGFVLIALALAGLVFGFEAMGRGLLPTELVAALIAGGMLTAGLYLLHAWRTPGAIIDIGLLRIPTFAASIVGGALFYIGTTAQVFLLAILLQVGFGLSPFRSGLTTLASAAGAVAVRFTFPAVLRLCRFRPLLIGNAILSGVFLAACGFFRPSTPHLVILAVLAIGGFSRSTQFTAVQSLGYAELPHGLMSRATSFSAMAQQLTQSFGVGLTALIVHLSLLWHSHAAVTPEDVAPGYFVLALLSFLAALVFLRLPSEAGAELRERR